MGNIIKFLNSHPVCQSHRSSDAGWEYVSSQVSSQKGLSFPVGTEVRSPDLGTPTQYSAVNRSKVIAETQPHRCHRVRSQLRILDKPGWIVLTPRPMRTHWSIEHNAMRDDQLRDLLTIRGMWGRSSSSSSTARPFKNIFKESDDGGADKVIAELIDRDVKASDEGQEQERSTSQAGPLTRPTTSSTSDNECLARMEADYASQIAELRSELRQAKRTEDRLRDDRDNWRQAAEYFHQDSQQDGGDDEEAHGGITEAPWLAGECPQR